MWRGGNAQVICPKSALLQGHPAWMFPRFKVRLGVCAVLALCAGMGRAWAGEPVSLHDFLFGGRSAPAEAQPTIAKYKADTVAFVRPHDIRITREANGHNTFPARIVYCNAAGPVANLELERLDGTGPFSAQLSKEEFSQLQPKVGEQVFVELKNVKIFNEDFSI